MTAPTMNALRFDALGSLDALKLTSMPRPTAAPGQVLVRVYAAGLNPSDVKNVKGLFPAYTTLPRVPGRDFAGIVEDGPPEMIGRRVWGSGADLGFGRDGSHAEYLTLKTEAAASLPDRLSFSEGASLGVPYLTAWNALERSGVTKGMPLLVIGLGAVGAAAAALGCWLGADVSVAVRRDDQRAAVEAAGATAIVSETGQALEGAFDVIFDTTGFRLADAVPALAKFGRIAIIAAPPGGKTELPALPLYRKGGLIVGVNTLLYDSTQSARMLEAIAPAFESGAITPPPFKEMSLSDGLAAYAEVDGTGRDKIVFKMV